MKSNDPRLGLEKHLISSTGSKNARGETIVRTALYPRLCFIGGLLPVGVFARVLLTAPGQESNPVWFLIGTALLLLLCVTAAWVWWPELRWTPDSLFIRPLFRRGKTYAWEDVTYVCGTRESWVLLIKGGVKFSGYKWTSGAMEFLDYLATRRGLTLPY